AGLGRRPGSAAALPRRELRALGGTAVMGLGPGLHIRQSQSLVMSQQLQAAIKLLALSNMELEAVIAEEVAKNPLLEVRPGEGGAEGGVVVTTDRETGEEAVDPKGSDELL